MRSSYDGLRILNVDVNILNQLLINLSLQSVGENGRMKSRSSGLYHFDLHCITRFSSRLSTRRPV